MNRFEELLTELNFKFSKEVFLSIFIFDYKITNINQVFEKELNLISIKECFIEINGFSHFDKIFNNMTYKERFKQKLVKLLPEHVINIDFRELKVILNSTDQKGSLYNILLIKLKQSLLVSSKKLYYK